MPALLGVNGGGHSVPERLVALVGQLGGTNPITLALGLAALALLWCGERWLLGRPVALGVVALSIVAVAVFGLTRFDVLVTGIIPPGLPVPTLPTVRLRDQDGIVALAAGCMLLAYIEGVAAARAFAAKHRESIDPRRELLGLAVANLSTAVFGGYPVAGGLSQTAVNEGAGARSRISLAFASLTLALCLLFFTTLLADLPKAVLAAVVLMAVRQLVDIRTLVHMWRTSRVDLSTHSLPSWTSCSLASFRASCSRPCCRFWFCSHCRRHHMLRSWDAFLARHGTRTCSAIPTMNHWLARSRSARKLRCSISMPSMC